jgi:hypothetical protein
MLRRRDTLLIILAALAIAILAWFFLARESDAPESGPDAASHISAPALVFAIESP